jgi:F0F1-type ATP synthase gamma subunit
MQTGMAGIFNTRLTKDVTNIIFRIEKQKEGSYFFKAKPGISFLKR